MPDLRNSTALRQLTDLGPEPDPPDWAWAIAHLEPSGRLRLPTEASRSLGASPGASSAAWGICHPTVLVLRSTGSGRLLTIDGRGRLYVPAWLRRHDTHLVVGTQVATSTVVVALTSLLDALGDQLAGGTA